MSRASPLYLMALSPAPKDWSDSVSNCLKNAGYCVHKRNSEVWLSDPPDEEKHCYRDGWRIKSLWLGPRKPALAAIAQRLYYLPSGQVDSRPETEIVGGKRPPEPTAQTKIDSQLRVLMEINEGCFQSRLSLAPLNEITLDVEKCREIRIGDLRAAHSEGTLTAAYKTAGFAKVPDNFRINICPIDTVPTPKTLEFSRTLAAIMKERLCYPKIHTLDLDAVSNRIDQLTETNKAPRPGSCILFLLPTHNHIISDRVKELWQSLEMLGVPFRRAYADDPFRFSVPDQAASIVEACDGISHVSSQRLGPIDVWSIGVDIGHDRLLRESRLCTSIVDPDGQLRCAWVATQKLDETPSNKMLAELLTACKNFLIAIDTSPNIIVLRDGRLFENERVETYFEVLGQKVTLLEVRKRGNPQIVLGEQLPKISDSISAGLVEGENTLFWSPKSPGRTNALPQIFKTSWRDEWNQLKASHSEIAHYLIASTTTPGLGLRPRNLPGPIYWADGIAKTSAEDLRFRGQRVTRLS
jgi:hypothetical protein